ncbi:MAG TPA: IS481 family transposase [Polyangiaceae bacterium]|nr:IS481 family transposase [Polyangiaceae bacterium]
MPWKDQGVVNQRMHFVTRLEAGERMAELCREYGISRKTGYKLMARFKEQGPEGLFDQSRRPLRISRRTPPEIVATIVALRKQHPTWGARKLRAWLERHEPALKLPTRSTFGDILRRNGLIEPRRSKQRTPRYSSQLRTPTKPNDVWCIDFKGQFRMGDSRLCYPLTVSDQYSRFLLGVEGLEDTKTFGARVAMERIFSEYGLPEVIRSDNGTPFSSRGIAGLSRLSVWWLTLGIQPERIEPGHPEQNGRHERMHRTLKKETARPAKANILQQQERFDEFVEEFNFQRPHEALDDRPPGDVFVLSTRPYVCRPTLEYPLHDLTKVVRDDGSLLLRKRQRFFLGEVLAGQPVGLRELDDGRWLVSFAHLHLGIFHPLANHFEHLRSDQQPILEALD